MKKYKFRNFLFDAFMVCMTGGFWLIYIYCREHRNK